MRRLKRILIVIFMLILVFVGYVEVVNVNSKGMTYRQKLMKAVYPLWMWWGKLRGINAAELSNKEKEPPVSFYSLKGMLNDGQELKFETLRGKKVLLVNTASDCGYTNQYTALQQLYEQNKDSLTVVGFPANDFKEQEKGTDEEIAEFCRENYGISFPLMQKSIVVKSPGQNPIFQWLTDSTKNGWNNKAPSWNFSKFIVDEQGRLTHYFGPTISPLSNDVKKAIQ